MKMKAAATTSLLVATGCARNATVGVALGTSFSLLGAAAMATDDGPDDGPIDLSMVGASLLVPGVLAVLAGVTELIVVDEPSEPMLTAIETSGVLVLANSPKETPETLAGGARIALTVARRIVTRRDGRDGIARTADDDRYDTLDELRAVPGVTRPIVLRMLQRANMLGYAR